LLDLTQDPRWIDSREIPVHMLINDFDEREELGQ
jgi:hypothetical protein